MTMKLRATFLFVLGILLAIGFGAAPVLAANQAFLTPDGELVTATPSGKITMIFDSAAGELRLFAPVPRCNTKAYWEARCKCAYCYVKNIGSCFYCALKCFNRRTGQLIPCPSGTRAPRPRALPQMR